MTNEITITFDESTLDEYASYYFEQHPKARNKPISRPVHPSINEWMRMKRMTMNSVKAKWKDFIIWLVAHSGNRGIHIDECEIIYKTFYKTNRRHDADNTTPKFVLDGLVESGLLADDDISHVRLLTLVGGVDASHPRTEICFKNITFAKQETNGGLKK